MPHRPGGRCPEASGLGWEGADRGAAPSPAVQEKPVLECEGPSLPGLDEWSTQGRGSAPSVAAADLADARTRAPEKLRNNA